MGSVSAQPCFQEDICAPPPPRSGIGRRLPGFVRPGTVMAGIFFLLFLTAFPLPAVQASPQQDSLWQEAEAARTQGDLSGASRLFQQYHARFPEAARAEEALWQAAQSAKQQALAEKNPDWEKVRNLFRLHTTEFPKALRAEEAYFELGRSHYRMRFYREALIYFKIFAERYPKSTLLPHVHFWQAETLAAVGQLAEAADFYRRAAGSGGPDLKMEARMRLGDTLLGIGDHAGALATFSAFLQEDPGYYLREPDVLRKLGIAQLRMGKEEEGRRSLYHYLNLTGNPPDREEALFEVAESYLREGDSVTALRLAQRILEQEGAGEGVARLARFRLAEAADDPEKKLPGWQKKNDLADPAGDEPFRAVLDHHHAEPIAQDARRALFRRYQARNDVENAQEMGRIYLRNHEPVQGRGKKEDFSGTVLLFLGEQLLARQEYEKLYKLYVAEHRHVAMLGNGRFLYLVGQALESMSLFDQALVVYHRALALPLSRADLAGLSFRRAELYLRVGDLVAASRLLVHLQKIYKDTKEIGEVYYLSGRLSEARGKRDEALEYYGKASLLTVSPSRRSAFAEAHLGLLLALGPDRDTLALLDTYKQKKWLAPETLQDWYGRLAEALADRDPELAIMAGLAGVEKDMPQTGLAAQRLFLRLGELYMNAGQAEKGEDVLQKARQGPDGLLGRKATERLNLLDIERKKRN